MFGKWRSKEVLGAVAVAGLMVLLPGGASGQKNEATTEKEAKQEAQLKADDISDLLLAYRLVELGRNKDKPAPEALIAAGSIYLRLSKVKMGTIAEKPTIQVDKKDDTGGPVDMVIDEAPDLEKEANLLFDEAEFMAKKEKTDAAPLINLVKNRGERGTLHGPKTVSRAIGPFQTQTFRLNYVPFRPAALGFKASVPMHVEVMRTDKAANVWYVTTGMHGGFNQVVGINGFPPGSAVPVRVIIQNMTQAHARYTLFTN